MFPFIALFKDESDDDELSDYAYFTNNDIKKPIQETHNVRSSVDSLNYTYGTVKVGALVEIEIMGKKKIGRVMWIGETGSPKQNTAGLEMVCFKTRILLIRKSRRLSYTKFIFIAVTNIELQLEEIPGGTDGTCEGERIFKCDKGKAVFVPVGKCKLLQHGSENLSNTTNGKYSGDQACYT